MYYSTPKPEVPGTIIWDIGKALNTGDQTALAKLLPLYEDFIDKWGGRCKTAQKQVPERFRSQMPNGISACRELSKFKKLGPNVLIECFERGDIVSSTIRDEVDDLYVSLGGTPVAKRHPKGRSGMPYDDSETIY
jgi:hypothetical protein